MTESKSSIVSGYAYIADYLNGLPITKIAEKHGVSRQAVSVVLCKLREHGLDVVSVQNARRRAEAAEARAAKVIENASNMPAMHGNSRLVIETISALMHRYVDGATLKDLADEFEMHPIHVSQLVGKFARSSRPRGCRKRACPLCDSVIRQ